MVSLAHPAPSCLIADKNRADKRWTQDPFGKRVSLRTLRRVFPAVERPLASAVGSGDDSLLY